MKAVSSLKVIGTYEGECADANITNLNGLDITRDVWENVFNSDEYKNAISKGWYIGYLGHPEDPGCQEFKNACIVMREGHIDDSGKVYGRFDLIDTPVGRIVKSFQDAGVTFGISVRGAGDIVQNSVDPDTFCFRGFDLVTFPAYPDAIPKFTDVAASADANMRLKYQKVCAAVNTNLKDIESESTLDIIQSQFAKQSDEYKAIEEHKNALNAPDDAKLNRTKLECMTQMYLDAVLENTKLNSKVNRLQHDLKSTTIQSSNRIKAIERIVADQSHDTEQEHTHEIEALNQKVIRCNKTISSLKSELSKTQTNNLKYIQTIESSQNTIRQKDSVIASLRSKLSETVTSAANTDAKISNLDEDNKKLKDDVKCMKKIISEYQEAYASLYATAIGVSIDADVEVHSNTSVSQLQKIISATNTCNIASQPELMADDTLYEEDIADSDDTLVTM